jgi:hypothetical protein
MIQTIIPRMFHVHCKCSILRTRRPRSHPVQRKGATANGTGFLFEIHGTEDDLAIDQTALGN